MGLEVHVQLLTRSKLFCSDETLFGAEPNTQVGPVSLAHPGTLPRLNGHAAELAVRLGLALNCSINQKSYFARKHYFYPDLPKGYQISQHEIPVCSKGSVPISTEAGERAIRLHHMHLEEDAGKSIHPAGESVSYIDLNRAGMPLMEIVSEPDIHTAEEAFQYLTELRRLVRWIGVCDGNMEQGSMRCDANISIRPRGDNKLGTRVEVKNLNSVRNVKRAIEYEFDRLVAIVEKGETVKQETRGFDDASGTTFSMRTKEDADDYRYFPDPDLPPVIISREMIDRISSEMPVLPQKLEKELVAAGISAYDASIICSEVSLAGYFLQLMEHTQEMKAAANWVIGPVRNYCNNQNIEILQFKLPPAKLARLIDLTAAGKINFTNGSGRVFLALTEEPEKDPLDIATSLNLLQETDDHATEAWVRQVIENMPDKVKEYRSGKKGLIGLFAGEVKKLSRGKADMEKVNALLTRILNKPS